MNRNLSMIQLLTTSNSNKWNEIVKSFPNHDVYYLSGYVRAFAAHGDGKPVLLYYTDDNGGRAICVLMIRDVARDALFKKNIPEGRYFDAGQPHQNP